MTLRTQADLSDEAFARRHRFPEVLEKKSKRRERERLVHERQKLKHTIERLRSRSDLLSLLPPSTLPSSASHHEKVKETERLRKQFGDQSNLLGSQRPPAQPQRHSAPHVHFQTQRPGPSRPQQRPTPVPAQPVFAAGPYLQPGGHRPTASASSFFSNGLPKSQAGQAPMKAKKSFWGLRSNSETNPEKLRKKKSSMF